MLHPVDHRQRHIDPGLPRPVGEADGVVQQRLGAAGVDVEPRQAGEVGVEGVGQRRGRVHGVAEHPGDHPLEEFGGDQRVGGLVGLQRLALVLHVQPRGERDDRARQHIGERRKRLRDARHSQIRALTPLSALFAIDAVGGGLVATAVIAYWLHVRFGAGASVLGPAFAGIALLQAASYELSGRLANRIGLIRTMVFTHVPSNLFLLLVPLSPTLPWAIGLLLARFSLSQMDVPARQAFVVSIVPPAERAGAVAFTGLVRGLGQAAGPLLAGAAIQGAALGLPFYLAGGLKLIYDGTLYLAFRGRRGEHETVR